MIPGLIFNEDPAGCMMPVPDMDKRYELDPDLFRPEAVDADTREFNEQLARKLAEAPPLWSQPVAATRAAQDSSSGPTRTRPCRTRGE
jgi:hypothetical protein